MVGPVLLAIVLGGAAAALPSPSPVSSPAPTLPAKGSTEGKDFPADIPRYQPASEASFRVSAAGALGHLITTDRPEKVAAFYAAFAAREHWSALPGVIAERENGRLMVYRKGERLLRVDAFANPLRKLTEVNLVVAREMPSPSPTASPGASGSPKAPGRAP